jgi:LPXTG-motif cell wall-anchored protein
VIYDRIQEIIWEALPILPMMAYSGVGAFRNTVMVNTFESSDASKESFARATPPAPATTATAAGQTSTPAPTGGSSTTMMTAVGAAVLAAGALWFWRRKSQADLDDGLDEKRS